MICWCGRQDCDLHDEGVGVIPDEKDKEKT